MFPRHQEDRAERKARNLAVLCQPATRSATYSGATRAAQPKPQAQRNPRLLAMAKDKPCLLRAIPGRHDPATTVACHSNWPEHGKAGARKADDQWSVWGCAECHRWLDQGGASEAEKRAVFNDALGRQRRWWAVIAASITRPAADRRAAQWALDRMKEEA